MPQLSKGGKFVFGFSVIREDNSVTFPPQAIAEYGAVSEGRVYVISGSKTTGGFTVSRRGLLENSKLAHILTDVPVLGEFLLPEGRLVRYKGRLYGWLPVSKEGKITLSEQMLQSFDIAAGMRLLAVRSSNIAFLLGAKGPLLEYAAKYGGTLEEF